MIAKPGSRWRSARCETEIVVVKAPPEEIDLGCGGAPLVDIDMPPPGGELDPDLSGGTMVGKRYVDPDATIEVLCTRPGKGTLTLAGVALTTKDAKPLPSSD